MPLVRDTDLVRIDLPADGEFAMVKRKMSKGDRIKISQSLFKDAHVQADAPLGTAILAAPDVLEAITFTGLELAVKRLCVSVGEGIPPVEMAATPEAIRELDEESIDHLIEKLNELYPVRTEAERLSLSANGATSPEAKVALPQS